MRFSLSGSFILFMIFTILSSGCGGDDSGNKPAVKTDVPNVTGFTALAKSEKVILDWTRPAGIVSITITRKTGSYPQNTTDGTVIFAGGIPVTPREDTLELENDTVYYYTLYTYDNDNNRSSGAFAEATPASQFYNISWKNTRSSTDVYVETGAITADEASGTVYLGTEANGLLISNDWGLNWTRHDPLKAQKYSTAKEIIKIRKFGTMLYAVTKIGIARSEDGGATWVKINLDHTGGEDAYDILACDSGGSKLLAAQSNNLMYSPDGGASWTKTAQNVGSPRQIEANSARDKIFVRCVSGTYYAPDWAAGSSQSVWNSLGGLIGSTAKDIAISGDGYKLLAVKDNGIAISENSGTNWTTKTTTDGLASDNIIAAHMSPDGYHICLATEEGISISGNGGTDWTTITTTDGLSMNQMNDIWCSSDGKKIYASSNSGLNYSGNSGVSWTVRNTVNGLGSDYVTRLLQEDNGAIWALTTGGLSRSTDGGFAWTNDPRMISSHEPNATDLWISGDGQKIMFFSYPKMLVSADGGTTWETSGPNLYNSNAEISGSVSGEVLAVRKGGELCISTDYGVLWETISLTEIKNAGKPAVSGDGSKIIVAADGGVYAGTCSGSAWSWNLLNDPLTAIYNINVSTEGGRIYSGSGTLGLVYSLNGGASWTALGNASSWLHGPTNIFALYASGDGSIVIAGGCSYGMYGGYRIAVSTDSMNTWTYYSEEDGVMNSHTDRYDVLYDKVREKAIIGNTRYGIQIKK